MLMVLVQDEATTVIALPKQGCPAQPSSTDAILRMKPPETLAMSVEYDPLYVFVSNDQ